MLIVKNTDPGYAYKRTILAIQDALNKALKWNHDLVTGQALSMNELAEKHGITQRYVSHLIKLAWLSPDIMKAIFRGEIPAMLSLDRLKRGFPLQWNQQRQELGYLPPTISKPN